MAKPKSAKPTKTPAKLRSFEDCLAAFRALGPLVAKPTKKPPALTKQATVRLDEVWSFADLSKVVPSKKVFESLAFIPDDKLRFEELAKLDKPADVLASSLWGGIGAWNAHDDGASWAGKKGEWMVVQAELVRDDQEYGCEVTFASWRVTGGLALLVTDLQHGDERVTKISGMTLPDSWKNAKVFYGE